MTTASPQGTPHAVDYGLVTSLATSLVFFDSAPDTEAMKSMITQAFGENLGPLEQSEKSLVVEINDEYALAFTPAAATRADLEGDPSFHQHPILSGDPAGWEDIACMVLINVFPSNERLELIKSTREARLHQLVTLGLATSAIAQTPGAIAVLNSVGRVAESTENYVEAVADKLPAHYLASTWWHRTTTAFRPTLWACPCSATQNSRSATSRAAPTSCTPCLPTLLTTPNKARP